MSSDQRRTFLKQVGGLAAVAAAAKAATASPAPQETVLPPSTNDARAYSAGRLGLELDGNFAGWIQSSQGGSASGEVVVEKPGPDKIARKHLSNVRYDDITIECDATMSPVVYDWITGTLEQKFFRKDGAIITADRQLKEVSRLSFSGALLTEIRFPAGEAGSRTPSLLTLRLSPEITRKSPGFPGRQLPEGIRKGWIAGNFRVELEGIPASTVSKVDALVVKVLTSDGQVGHDRDYGKEPIGLEVPNLAWTFPASASASFLAWHEDFVVKGFNGQEDEKLGKLQYLAQGTLLPLFSLDFAHLGIFKLGPEPLEAQGTAVQKWRADMYCEEIAFHAVKS